MFNPPPGTPPLVIAQPVREPIPKPWIETPVTPSVIEKYVPTEADLARWAKEHQDFKDLHTRLAREELEEINRLEQLDETERLKHTHKAPTGLARLFA